MGAFIVRLLISLASKLFSRRFWYSFKSIYSYEVFKLLEKEKENKNGVEKK